ncbi:hypothetical protein MRX96_016872 [Rhipicephalus microplus]
MKKARGAVRPVVFYSFSRGRILPASARVPLSALYEEAKKGADYASGPSRLPRRIDIHESAGMLTSGPSAAAIRKKWVGFLGVCLAADGGYKFCHRGS